MSERVLDIYQWIQSDLSTHTSCYYCLDLTLCYFASLQKIFQPSSSRDYTGAYSHRATVPCQLNWICWAGKGFYKNYYLCLGVSLKNFMMQKCSLGQKILRNTAQKEPSEIKPDLNPSPHHFIFIFLLVQIIDKCYLLFKTTSNNYGRPSFKWQYWVDISYFLKNHWKEVCKN